MLLLFCSSGTDLGGSISDVDLEIAYMYGYIVDANGSAIENVEVVAFNPDTTVGGSGTFGRAVDTYYTEIDGKYQFDSLDQGTYTILANYEDSLYVDNLNIYHDSITFVGIDTLKEPGYIKGSVVLDDNNNMGVLVYIPGTDHIAVSDSLGNFLISNVPADSSYKLVFQYYGYATVQFSEIVVQSSDTTSLSPVILSKNQYPVGLVAELDSLTNTVTVTWNKMHNDDIVGYVIYRKDSSQTALYPTQLNTNYLMTDTLFKEILNEKLFSQSDTITFQYQVRAKNSKEDLSPFSNKVFIRAHSLRDSNTVKTISVTSPSINDSLSGLDNYKLLWDFTGIIDSVNLQFTPNNGASWFNIESSVENDGFYYWAVPNINSSLCKFRVMDISNELLYDESDLFTIAAIDNGNIIKNGDFAQGVAYWKMNKFEGAKSNYGVVDGECNVFIDSGGSEYWHVTLAQTNLPIMQGYVYKFSFDARAESEKEMKIGLGMFFEPYTTYSEITFTISTDMKSYSGELTMPYPDDFNSVLMMAVGVNSHDIVIDNISLEIVQ